MFGCRRSHLLDAGDPARLAEELLGLGDPQPRQVAEPPWDQQVVRVTNNGSAGARTRNSRRRWLPEIDLRHSWPVRRNQYQLSSVTPTCARPPRIPPSPRDL